MSAVSNNSKRGWGELLDRVDGLRQTGPHRWLARCPAHDDTHPSLSIRDADDRLLVHCFTGCEPLDVVHAVGLELRHLFADSVGGQFENRPSNKRVNAADALMAVSHELQVAALICADVLECRTIDETTWERLAKAARRIGRARDNFRPARVGK